MAFAVLAFGVVLYSALDAGRAAVAVLLVSAIGSGLIADGHPVDVRRGRGAAIVLAFLIAGVVLSVVLYPRWMWQAVFWPMAVAGMVLGHHIERLGRNGRQRPECPSGRSGR